MSPVSQAQAVVRPRAVLVDNGSDWVELVAPYVAQLVTEIKVHIEPRHRKYQPDAKTWLVLRADKALLLRIAQRSCDVLDTSALVSASVRLETAPGPAQAAYAVLDLLPSAGAELVKAAYRIKAKSAHPDLGGTTQAMARINAARDAIEK